MAKCAWRVLQLRQTRHALQGGTFKPGQIWAGNARLPGPTPSSGAVLMAGVGELYGSTPGIQQPILVLFKLLEGASLLHALMPCRANLR